MHWMILLLLAACDDPAPPIRGPHPEPKKATAAERREARDQRVRESAKASGYAFAVCTKPTRDIESVALVTGNNVRIELVPTVRGFCYQFDGLRPGQTGTYSLRPDDNSLVRGLSVCAPSTVYKDDDPDPNPCTHLPKTDAHGAYTFVIHPRVAEEPVIEIGPLRPGAPLMWPDDDPDATAMVPPVPAAEPPPDPPAPL